ncbi:MAG: hypothetical protein WCP18_02270, partial [bacterium]
IKIYNAEEVSINNSNIYNPTQPFNFFGDDVYSYISYGINSSLSNIIDVTNNYWGSADGPTTVSDAYLGLIKGTILFEGNFNYQPYATSAIDLFPKNKILNPVILIPGVLGSWPDLLGQWQLDPILNTYDNLWQALKNAGYEEGKNLFSLPYNWRLSNVITAGLLKTKIQEIKNICNCDKVDLVAHSMGGIVARTYIEGDGYNNDVDKLIFLATPHLGSTKTYLMWASGIPGIRKSDWIFSRIFNAEAERNGFGSASQYIRNKPIESVNQILPIYSYLRDKGSNSLRQYPDNYPRNYFLEQLNQADNLAKLNSVQIYNFLANTTDEETITNLRVVSHNDPFGDWSYGEPENFEYLWTDQGIEYGPGDTTVPKGSNSNFNNSPDIIIDSDHTSIPTDAQKQVIKILTGTEPTTEVRENFVHNAIMVQIHSPADFVITAPDGKKLGFGQNQIPNAFYTNIGEQFAVIKNPLEGEYKVDLTGTGNGSYKLVLSYLDDQNNTDNSFNGQITVGEQQSFTANYSQASGTSIELKPVDHTPPIINITNPIASSSYFRSDILNINYTAIDDFSGTATISITLNNQPLATSTLNLSAYPVGNYNLVITAIDVSGNTASSTVNFQIITDLPHTISDVKNLTAKNQALMAELTVFQLALKTTNATIDLAIKTKQKLEASNYNAKIKSQLIMMAQKTINKLTVSRTELINKTFDRLSRQLENLYNQTQLSASVYAIIKSDFDYLKINL